MHQAETFLYPSDKFYYILLASADLQFNVVYISIYRFSVKDSDEPETVCNGNFWDICYSGGCFYGRRDKEIVRNQADSGDITVLCSSDFTPENLSMTRDYIYFRSSEKISYGRDKTQNGGQEIFYPKSDIYRIPVSGGDVELVYSLTDEMKHYYLGNFVVDGNYLYAQWAYCNTETGEYFESWNHAAYDYMRIDLRNGDVYYIGE